MNKNIVMTAMVVLILGLIGTNVYSYVSNETSLNTTNPLANLSQFFGSVDRPSPYDRIKEEQIHVYHDKVIIDIQDPQWAGFSDTNSMDPLIDMGVNAIEIVPKSAQEIHIGDVISYESEYADGTIIHRVIEIGEDNEGTYFILKGDNNQSKDPGRIRFHQVKRILVAVIY